MTKNKFRGWHTLREKMFSAEEMAHDQLTLLPTGSFINVNSVSTKLSEIYPSDKFIPLQFTGLHDKNGKEIYEGDLVKSFHPTEFVETRVVGEVTWSPENKNYMYAGWYIRPHNKHIVLMAGHIEYEVIGNVFENPDLLIPTKEL